MKDYHSYSSRPPLRRGFTLVELLVVVGIVLLLVTMTVVAVDFSFKTERVRSAARQLQSMLEGARDRAIHAGAPRGVRIMVEDDRESGRKSASMIYIASTEPWFKGTITLKRSDFATPYGTVDTPAQGNDRDGNGVADTDVYMVEGSPETLWYALLQRGYLPVYEFDSNSNGVADPGEDLNGNGVIDRGTARIKIPGDRNGTWYNVSTRYLGRNPANPHVLELIRPYRDPGTTPPAEVVAFEGTGVNSYVLELPPRVLADAEPIMLPAGVVIDLDASDVPDAWRPANLSTLPTGVTQWQMAYSSQMDILFSPRGTVTGPVAAKGLIHFCLALREDVDAMTISGGITPSGQTVPARAAVWAGGTWNANTVIVGENTTVTTNPPTGDRGLVTVFTQTGKVASYPLNPLDGGDADQFADDPYLFARQGKGLTQ